MSATGPREPRQPWGETIRARIHLKTTSLLVIALGFTALGVAGTGGLALEGDASPIAWITTLALVLAGGFMLAGVWRARTMAPRYVELRPRAIVLPEGAPVWSSPDVELRLADSLSTEIRVRRGMRCLELIGPLRDRYVLYGTWIGEDRLDELVEVIRLRRDALLERRSPVVSVASEALAMDADLRTLGVVIDTSRPKRPRAVYFLGDLEDYETLLARPDFPLHDHTVVLAAGSSDRMREAIDERLAAAREVVGFREAPR